MSERPGDRSRALLERWKRRGGELEVLEKRGRSRSFESGAEGEISTTAVESGWAVRGGDRAGSFFAAGSGELPLSDDWPRPSRQPLELPEPRAAGRFVPPPGLDAPLAGETEARALAEAVARELARELPSARLVHARFEEGSSETSIRSSRGIASTVRARLATLRLEAVAGSHRVVAEASARAAAEMKPLGLARRLADRLLALGERHEPAGPRLLLAGPLVARLVEALAPRLLGPDAEARLAPLLGTAGRLGAEGIRIVDDGALAGGLLAAAADGEGVPCRAVELVADGRFVRPLVAWWESARPEEASGCARRAGYRDLPRRAPTHLYLEPDPSVSVAELVGEADVYLLDAEGGVALDSEGRFEVRVSGFALAGG
ncbi:MAG TPA: metallopeptidase TldD-related protein, partial [Thermoanaerobaculia bacterium]|nr:metallopeptidase TldD-related protein [Thermoanaerobaculia bacterium]